jgi:hypothetical protein
VSAERGGKDDERRHEPWEPRPATVAIVEHEESDGRKQSDGGEACEKETAVRTIASVQAVAARRPVTARRWSVLVAPKAGPAPTFQARAQIFAANLNRVFFLSDVLAHVG